jgi:mannosyltransferase
LRHRRYLPVFVVTLAAELYTHNWGLFLGLMAGAALLLCIYTARGPERRALWIDGVLAFGLVALLYVPWLPTVVYQAHHTGAPWDLPPVIWSLTQSGYVLVGGRGAAIALLLAAGSGFAALYKRTNTAQVSLLAARTLFLLGVGTLVTAWLYSKVTPAWAFRYLAMIIGPLMLLFAFGVSRAGRLGLVALVLSVSFWVLDPQRHNPNWKSNVAGAIAHVRSDIRADSLVLSTQPEQVPTIAYYLPQVKRFGTPLGPVADPRIMDWRNALERFRRSSVRSVLLPMLRGLRAGQTVALVFPVNLAKAPEWMIRINDTSDEWNAVLERDPQLKFRATTVYGMTGSGVAVRVSVYEKR